jgi:hypothetical protein
VFEKLAVEASGTSQTGAPDRSNRQARVTPQTLFMKLTLHHLDEMTQVRLGGFVSTL